MWECFVYGRCYAEHRYDAEFTEGFLLCSPHNPHRMGCLVELGDADWISAKDFLHAFHANILLLRLTSLPQKSPGSRVNKRATRPEWVIIDNNGKPGKVGVVVLFC